MFRTVTWRYGARRLEEWDELEDAVSFGEYGADEGDHLYECVIDENDIIVHSSARPGYQTKLGARYIFD